MSLISLMSIAIYAEEEYQMFIAGSTNLCGTEKAWQFSNKNLMTKISGSVYSITYSNLPAGHYEFLAFGCYYYYMEDTNGDGIIEDELSSYADVTYTNISSDCSTEGYYLAEMNRDLWEYPIAFELKETSDVTIKLLNKWEEDWDYEREMNICLTSTKGFAKQPFETTINGVVYKLSEASGNATIVRLEKNYVSDLVIPETVTYEGITFTVTEIGDKAFQYSTLNSITLPATITTVGQEINYQSSCKIITFLSEKAPSFYYNEDYQY